jgi:hypothetical protein
MTLRTPGAALRLLILRSQASWLRPAWRFAHSAVVRVIAVWLLARVEGASIYVKGGFGPLEEPVYGVSDVDLVVVVATQPAGPGVARIRRRWRRASRLLPFLADLVDLFVYEEAELAKALSAPFPTYGLGSAGHPDAAAFAGPAPLRDEMGLQDRPGLYAPTYDWSLLRGRERRSSMLPYGDQQRRLVAWLELQLWWRYVAPVCIYPGGPRTAHLCVKLIAEPTRILLWLLTGERLAARKHVLERGLAVLPEEAEALELALRLYRDLPKSPPAPLAEILPPLVRLSSRIAARLAEEAAPAGSTAVALQWGGVEELVLKRSDGDAVTAPKASESLGLHPLVDWRALAVPPPPDEAFALLAGSSDEPSTLANAALASRDGVYRMLRAPGVLIAPIAHERPPAERLPRGVRWKRAKLRGIQCELTDPVSFALAEGRNEAGFPNVAGWSIRDVARRAVGEHRAWLSLRPGQRPPVRGWMDDQPDPAAATVATLGRLLAAARAALLDESVRGGSPQLPLTAAATAEQLAERQGTVRSTVQEALGAYREARVQGCPPPVETVHAFAAVVRSLPQYRTR